MMKAKFCKQCGVPLLLDGELCQDCITHQKNPDELSKRKMLAGIPFTDMKQRPEEARFIQIAQYLYDHPGKIIGVMVDHGPQYQGKAERYIEEIKKLIPEAKVLKRFLGPAKGVETIQFRYDI